MASVSSLIETVMSQGKEDTKAPGMIRSGIRVMTISVETALPALNTMFFQQWRG